MIGKENPKPLREKAAPATPPAAERPGEGVKAGPAPAAAAAAGAAQSARPAPADRARPTYVPARRRSRRNLLL